MDAVTLGQAKADAKKKYNTLAAFATERAPIPVVDFRARPGYNGSSAGSATETGGNYRYRHTAIVTATGIRLAFGNYNCVSGVETDGANDITVRASLENTATKFAPVFFNGKRDVVISPGATVWSDPIGFEIIRGQIFYSRTYVTVASGTWPKTIALDSTRNEGFVSGTSTTDLTGGGAITTSNLPGYGPMAIWGLPTVPHKTVVGILGDSIAAGYGETAPNVDRGYIERGLNNQIAFQCVAIPSARIDHWRDGSLHIHWRRSPLLDRATDIICELGVNDLATAFATWQSWLIEVWRLATNRGAKVRQTTITPSSTSTDGFATVANQTPGANEANRLSANAWLRDGAPMLNGAAAAVGSSAAGTVRAGQAGHPLVGVIEVADLAESARNSGKWKAGYTTDGIHPNSTAAAALAPAIAALVGTALTPAV